MYSLAKFNIFSKVLTANFEIQYFQYRVGTLKNAKALPFWEEFDSLLGA